MNDILILALAWLAGAGLGGVFFAGLWWTIRNGLNCKHPALLFLGSWLLRSTLVVAGFYLVGGSQWQRWLSCLVGFIMARLLVSHLTNTSKSQQVKHAS
ncbi:ATP synthase subunit I [Methylomonas paludis]|uniref:ATP synthase subunit I n=2 Tax=Methylomonas paludis TaxID=1173101 RepID=A0A975MR77_9GAMM|nr:ATP synthase subunit I [Methylomonas paludis]